MPRDRRPLPPLDAAMLDRMALRYVERFATTRGRLADYLTRKIRERGWSGAAVDTVQVAERLAALGYIDDLAYAGAKAAAMARRGLGARRVGQALRHAGVGEDDAGTLRPDIDARATAAALAYARRRRIGPFATGEPDRDLARRQLAAMIRAGHGFTLARTIVRMAPGSDPDLVLTGTET